jgi:5-methylcytosine-specific restriction endonuclease McrA
MEDCMEVYNIVLRSQGGLDHYNNLQLLHTQCHVTKTSIDLRSSSENLAGAG